MIAVAERPTAAVPRVGRAEPSGIMASLSRALDFQLPAELEAHEPPEARGLARDGVRLLVTVPGPDWVVHASFVDLPDFLGAGDVVVVNDSATLSAALTAHTADGRAVALSTRCCATRAQPRRARLALVATPIASACAITPMSRRWLGSWRRTRR